MGALTTTEGRAIKVATSGSATEPLRLVELRAPSLGPRDVRVQVRAAGVNPVDWKMRAGGPLRFAYRFVGPSGPLVIGVDFAGEVIEAGPEADLAPGDRVVGGTDFSRKQRGSYATEVTVRDDQCAKLPDEVSFEDAACLPIPGATALRAFEVAKLDAITPAEERRVLVLGASGGVGIVTLQLLKAMGAKGVGVCSTRNVALVERLGGVAVDYTKGDALEAARAHGPFDLILHGMGTETYPLAGCRSLLSKRGVVALIVVRPVDFWPRFDENTACGLCYTSGTTGNPKGVLYSHRSNVLHAPDRCRRRAGAEAHRHDAAGGADVPRQRLVACLLRPMPRRQAGHARRRRWTAPASTSCSTPRR
jgi:NADPH:quinone reductase-like Zn-dependent oxidoreductase